MNSLNDKLDRVKDAHAEAELETIQQSSDEQAIHEAIFFLGRVKQNDHMAQAIAMNLSAQSIRALEHFQQEKQFESLGYSTFVDFLEKSKYSPMTKRQYYDRLALIREHGDEIYDLLTSVGISVRAQKLLGKGELSIRGDRLVVGNDEIEIGNSGLIKEVLEELVDEKRQLQIDKEKLTAKVEKQQQTIDQGQEDFNELRRNLDQVKSGDPFDGSVSYVVHSLLRLEEEVGSLSDAKKKKKAEQTLGVIWTLVQRLRVSFESEFAFTQGFESPDTDDLARRAFAGDDDFGDDEE